MKYICVINENDVFEIITFPRHIDHDVMAESVSALKNQTRGSWQRELRTPVSAGFITSDNVCHGKSITLGLEAREEDTALLERQLALVKF